MQNSKGLFNELNQLKCGKKKTSTKFLFELHICKRHHTKSKEAIRIITMSQQLLTFLMTYAGEAEVRPSGGWVSCGGAGFTRGSCSLARRGSDQPPGRMRASGRRLNWNDGKRRREKALAWALEMAAVQESGKAKEHESIGELECSESQCFHLKKIQGGKMN